jgi:general secretion pathway protein B
MSYILDALRRADSERERGAVPSLNAQPEPLLPDDEPAPPGARRWILLAAGLGVIVLLGGTLAWALTRSAPAPAGPAGAATAMGNSQVPAGTPNAPPPGTGVGGGAPGASAPSLPPLPPEAYAPPPAAPKPVARAEPAAGGLASTATAPAAVAPARSPGAAGAAGARRAAPSAPGDGRGAEPPRVYAQHELPEEVRLGIPALVVNGSVYSKSAADRFLIINGQIVHENGVVAPDVVLEQIKQRSAVLRSKGFRFEITF